MKGSMGDFDLDRSVLCECHTYKLALCEALSEEDTSRPHYVVQHVAVLNQSTQGLIKVPIAPCFVLVVRVHLTCTTQLPQHGGR